MKLNCIIVDDEPVARRLLSEYVQDVAFLELRGMAENPLKAAVLLDEHAVDLMFLDINMPKLTGLQFLGTRDALPMTILTTAYAEYAVEGFELNALDYLVKPFSFERFLKAANKAREYMLLKGNRNADLADDYFFVKCNGKFEKVEYRELLYVEAMLNYVVLHTTTRKLIVYLTIKGIEEQLPVSKFLKVHKSYIVNLSRVKNIDGNQLNLGTASITISQGSYDKVIKTILRDKLIRR